MVHGAGGVGLSAVMIGVALGARVVAVDVQPSALALASDIGASAVVDAGAGDVVSAVLEATEGGAHVSLDALGSAETCANSIAGLRKRGRHIQVGILTGAESAHPVPMAHVIARELEVLGSHGMAAHGFPRLLAMVERGVLHPARLVQRRIDLATGARLLTEMDRNVSPGMAVIEMTSTN